MLGQDSLTLLETDEFHIQRRGRFLAVHLKNPYLVLSTSQVNGGQTESVRVLLNHQSCEGKSHSDLRLDLHQMTPEAYHQAVCLEANLDPGETAMMGTAANMQYAAFASESYQEITVCAIATAGVQGNAGRAGDSATWHEGEKGYQSVHAVAGTINVIVLFNWPLSVAAMTRAVATMTEAKSAVLQELAIGSRYSPELATGTGTDQFCLAAPLDSKRIAKTWTGKHAKLGELLAKVVKDSIREALKWQNGLEPSRTRHLGHALGRFGVDEMQLRIAMGIYLNEKDHALAENNFQAILHEPQVAGSAYAMAAVYDRLSYGTLPEMAAKELMLNQAALMAASLAAKPEAFGSFRQSLSKESGMDFLKIPDLVAKALALGWQSKWR